MLIYENVTYLSGLFLEAKSYFFDSTIRKGNGLKRKVVTLGMKGFLFTDTDKTSCMEGRVKSEVLLFRTFFFKYDH